MNHQKRRTVFFIGIAIWHSATWLACAATGETAAENTATTPPRTPIEIHKDDIDLDGDGKADPFVLAAIPSVDGALHEFTITAGDSTYEEQLYDVEITGSFTIVDLDTTDRFKEIAVPTAGHYSGAYTTRYYGFDGSEIRLLGSVYGPEPDFDGAGHVHSWSRGRVIHTWFYPVVYVITAQRTLARVEQELWLMGTHVTLKRDLAVQAERVDGPPLFVALTGERGVLAHTDDRMWCQIAMSDGRSGWFRCCCGIGSAPGADVFAGYPGGKWRGTVAVTLLKDVPLYSWKTGMGATFTTACAGEKGVLNIYSNEHWLELVTTTGKKGLLHRYENGYMGGFYSHEVFEGLSFAE